MSKKPEFDLLKIVGLRPKPKAPQKYASFNQRMMALTLDSFVILFITTPLTESWLLHYFPITQVELVRPQDDASILAMVASIWRMLVESGALTHWVANTSVQIVFFVAYSVFCLRRWSATPGKMLLRLKVADSESEQPITLHQAWVRTLTSVLVGVGGMVGYMLLGYHKNKQAWHDRAAGTVVLRQPIAWKELLQKFKPGSQAAGQ